MAQNGGLSLCIPAYVNLLVEEYMQTLLSAFVPHTRASGHKGQTAEGPL